MADIECEKEKCLQSFLKSAWRCFYVISMLWMLKLTISHSSDDSPLTAIVCGDPVAEIYDTCKTEVSKNVVEQIKQDMHQNGKYIKQKTLDTENTIFDNPLLVIAVFDSRYESNIEGSLEKISEEHYPKVALIVVHVKSKDTLAVAGYSREKLAQSKAYKEIGLVVDWFTCKQRKKYNSEAKKDLLHFVSKIHV